MAPLNYFARRAARSYITGPDTFPTVANPRANPAYAAQVFSPDHINRIARAQVTGQPVMLPGVEVTAPKSNTPAGTAQSKPSYDTNTLWGWMKSTGTGDASYGGRRDLWNKFYGSGTTAATGYTGTAEQNTRLLEALKKANTMGVGIEKAAAYTNLPSLRAPGIKKIDPTKKLESKNPEVKKPETKPTI